MGTLEVIYGIIIFVLSFYITGKVLGACSDIKKISENLERLYVETYSNRNKRKNNY